MLKKLIVTAVRFSARYPWPVLAVVTVLSLGSASFVADRFALNTDITTLISPNVPWRQLETAYFKAFPRQDTAITVVVDAPTPELAEDAAEKFTQRLNRERTIIQGARQMSGGPFFQRNGLLYLSPAELKESLEQLSKSRALLEPLAADPSLRGVMSAISLTLRGVQARRISLDTLAPQFDRFSATIEGALAGRPAYFSWRELLSGGSSALRETRQFLEVYPVVDFNSLQPGEDATGGIRQAAADLKLAASGVTVRVTGTIPIADDEFATLQEGAALNGVLTVLAVLIILWLALHSMRIIFAVFVSLFAGLFITAAIGLALVGAFNPISVAFFVLFVGIGVDFGLQFSVSYRAERFERDDLTAALLSTASNTGGRLALAAAATAAGFMAFTPTAYEGLSELGQIAGVGMIVAFVMSITVLPALLKLLNPPAEPHPLGYKFLAPVDRFLERHRVSVLVVTLCTVLAGLPLLYWLSFDFDPMDLRSPKVESVATYLDIRKDPELAGRTVEMIAPSLSAADSLAKTIGALPEVAKTMTLSSFVPEDQDAKLAQIGQAAASLNAALNPQQAQPAPTEAETVNSLESTSVSLAALAKRAPGAQGARAAQRLSAALANLAKAAPDVREKAQAALVFPLKITLNDIRQSLTPGKVTLNTLPADLVATWQTADGRARISVSPRGGAMNNSALEHFVEVVSKAAPGATGEAVGIVRAAETIVQAFIEAAIWALGSIAILLWLSLRRISDVLLTLFPLVLAGIVTLECTVLIGMPLNYANIIALPLLLGVGVAFKIYYIWAWREGRSGLLASPLTRAVFFSGMTTAVAFGSLMLSNHPGTASMGQLLALSLVNTMAAAVLFQPLLMGPPRRKAAPEEKSQEPAYLGSREHTA
jgi:hopanoid biosynthesis associated RND transporter like protein HpnN